MTEPILIYARYTFTDADGHLQEVEMRPDLAAEIGRLDEAMRMRDRRHAKREVSFTDAKINASRITRQRESPRPKGNAWQGPRFSFALLIGESRTWPGPPKPPRRRERCEFCKGAELPLFAYCLYCDRCGRDLAIPQPSKTELARIRSPEDDGLKGGTEGNDQKGKKKGKVKS